MVELTVLDARCYVCGHLISGPTTIYTDKGQAHPSCVNCSPYAEARIAELEAENARLKASLAEALKALEPFAEIEWADEDGWSHDSPYRDRVCDWFGPSDFRTASRVREGGSNG